MTSILLSWLVFLSAVVLCFTKAKFWADTWGDWAVVKVNSNPRPVWLQARGLMRSAWLRLLDGVCWLTLAVLTLRGSILHDYIGRVVLLIMIILEIAKIATDQLTRYQIDEALGHSSGRGADYDKETQ